jgi:[ribosomal protein S5]-alanine N-acetyltransferase
MNAPDRTTSSDGRLRLRRPTASDLDMVWAIHGDPETNRFNPSGPLRSRAEAEKLLTFFVECWESDGVGYYLVEEVPAGAPVGFVGVRHADARDWDEPAEPVLNLYYRFSPAVWGRGYATGCARDVLAWAATHRPDRPVVVVTTPDNTPSLAVAVKLGFRSYRGVVHSGAPSVEDRLP